MKHSLLNSPSERAERAEEMTDALETNALTADFVSAVPSEGLQTALPDTGDVVRHKPSGEHWIVAFVRDDRLCALGWPETLDPLADFVLVTRASPDKRQRLLREMVNTDGARGTYARRRLLAESHEAQDAAACEAPAEARPTDGKTSAADSLRESHQTLVVMLQELLSDDSPLWPWVNERGIGAAEYKRRSGRIAAAQAILASATSKE